MAEHPENRAGGGFNGAAPPPRKGGDEQWDYWFNLAQAALRKDWQSVERQLREGARFDLPHHLFTAQLFTAAADAGRLDVVAEMFRRSFRLPPEEGRAATARLAKAGDAALPVICFLAKNGYADATPAVYHYAADGTPPQMADLKAGGCDILLDGSSFSIAFYAGNLSMMRYLCHQGADIYRPSVIAGLHGGLSSYRRRYDGDADESATRRAFRDLVAEDARSLEMYYAYCCPDRAFALDDFRRVPGGCTEKGWTLLHLAARSGNIADVLEAARREKDRPLMAEDLLRKDANGVSALSILAAREEEHVLFAHDLWRHDPGEAVKLNDALKDMQAGAVIDPGRFAAEVRRRHLSEMARSGRWSLHPERKKGGDREKGGGKKL